MIETTPLRRDLFAIAPPPAAPPPPKPTLEDVTPTAPLSPATLAFAHAASLGAKNDATFAAANAPYTVKNAAGESFTVNVPPQFRMVGGWNYHVDKKGHCTDGLSLMKALGADGAKLEPAVRRVLMGRGTPEDVAQITRALIGKGHLGPVDAKSAPAAIQAMQWRFGVGLDCAGYVQHAFFAARGKTGTASERAALGLANVSNENFAGLPKNAKWRSVSFASARAGDVVLLGAPKGDTVGHVVLVRSNRLLDDAEKKQLGLTSAGPVRRLEVDSSWGAGEKGTGGGVMRRVWLHDESNHTWSSYDPATKAITATKQGPYDHPLTGIYRPKGEP